MVANDDRGDAGRFVRALRSRHRSIFAGDMVLDVVRSLVEIVDRPGECIIRDIIEVAPEAKPGSGHRDMVRSALPFRLDEQFHSEKILAIPRRERFKLLETLRLWVDVDGDVAPV